MTTSSGKTILAKDFDAELLAKWPQPKNRVPRIFLHKPVNIEQHVKIITNMGLKFYKHVGNNYVKVNCLTINDHQNLVQYFQEHQMPFHTFGIPANRIMKVVIREIPKDITDINKIKEELKSVNIPIIRVHKMHTKEERKDNTILVLAVVPYDNEGKQILKLTQLLGHVVKLEPPVIKPKQCHRCQKWGHSQRYCYGLVKCVKCGEGHMTEICSKPKRVQPKCANCSLFHTANYKNCIYSHKSKAYKMRKALKRIAL